MKAIRYVIVAAALGCGWVSYAQAHMFVGIGVAAPVYPVVQPVPAVPVYVPPAYYAPPPAYYAPPPVVAGYYGAPYGYAYPRHYGCWNCGYGYWAR
jgi:hypothetical protein